MLGVIVLALSFNLILKLTFQSRVSNSHHVINFFFFFWLLQSIWSSVIMFKLFRSNNSIVLFCNLYMITSWQWNICFFSFPINWSERLIVLSLFSFFGATWASKFVHLKKNMNFKICYDHIHGSKVFVALYFVTLSQKISEYTIFKSNHVAKSWVSDLAQKLTNTLANLKFEIKKLKQLSLNLRKILLL